MRSRHDLSPAILTCRSSSRPFDVPLVFETAEVECQIKAGCKSERRKPVGPFNETYAVARGIVDAEFDCFVRLFQPVQIKVPDIADRHLVELDQREGRTGNFSNLDPEARSTRADERTGKCRFPGPQISREANRITRRSGFRYPAGQALGLGSVQ